MIFDLHQLLRHVPAFVLASNCESNRVNMDTPLCYIILPSYLFHVDMATTYGNQAPRVQSSGRHARALLVVNTVTRKESKTELFSSTILQSRSSQHFLYQQLFLYQQHINHLQQTNGLKYAIVLTLVNPLSRTRDKGVLRRDGSDQ
jgi:hypothetical protein